MGAVWCWDCTPNATHFCNMMDQYMMKLCMNDNSSCYMASVMIASVKTYTLGCLELVRESSAYCIIYIIYLEELRSIYFTVPFYLMLSMTGLNRAYV